MAPLQAAGWQLIGKKGQWQVIQIEATSDGQQRNWPPQPYRPSTEERYLVVLGDAWAKKLGVDQPGIQYYLDKLPDGYATFEVDQPGGPQTYKRLFGHPTGKFYDSIVRFQPHFLWLMSGMEGDCECINCGKFKREAPIRPRMQPAAYTQNAIQREKPTLQPVRSYESDTSSRSNSTTGQRNANTTSRPQRHVRNAGAPYAQDSEGTEDVYKQLLKTLESNRDSKKGIEDDIREPNSIDWRAEHSWAPPNAHDWEGVDILQRSLTSIEHQHTFVPRVGELVLFCPHFLDQHYLMLDEEKQEYKFYSFEQKCFHGFPTWRAGVVAAIPSDTAVDGPIDFPDIQDLPKKHTSPNTSGFRVETFPDPNDEEDKGASKQYRYLPLRNIRPLNHWQMLLRGIERERWHRSIEYALTCMTTISLLEKFYFTGDWSDARRGGREPHASIRCKGVFIGPELITIGDAVRIMPEKKDRGCTDVLVVESIRLYLSGIKEEHFTPDTGLLSTKSYITLVGKAYTIDPRRPAEKAPPWQISSGSDIVSPEDLKTIFRPVGTALYGRWYPLHAPENRYEISHEQILGRLCEGAAVNLWTGSLQRKPVNGEKYVKPSLDYDLKGVQEGRKYATRADARLPEHVQESLLWFWADTRAEALDVQTLNGVEVGKYDTVRDKNTLEMWKTQMKILNGLPVETITTKFTNFVGLDLLPEGGKRGRKAGSKVIDGKVYRAGEIPPGYDKPLVIDESPEPGELLVHLTPSKHRGSKMAGAALVSTDEDEDEENEENFEDAKEEWSTPLGGLSGNRPVADISPIPRPLFKPKQPKTKAEIMSSAVDEDSFSDDEVDYAMPILARGGTEESEGGDYDPNRED